MAEYIDRESYCAEHCLCNKNCCDKGSCTLFAISAADVAPVVHGEWLDRKGGFFDFAACSNCKEEYPLGGDTLNYCPNCGAKMDGAVNE